MSEPKTVYIWLKNWLTRNLVAYVPDEIAHCEFGCRKGQCTEAEWETCVNRARALSRLSLAHSAEADH